MIVHTENSIVIRAPLERVFQTTANVLLWPSILPHYRWIRVLETSGDGLIVKMAARRAGLPIQWTSRFRVDDAARELHFQHLKAFTRGMNVKWTYTPAPGGVLVRISHELNRSSALGRWFANCVLGKMFITPVATLTLTRFKQHLEQKGT
ncbi:MAG TPA: SRPBCC family protein [Verrucomicrobiae bacterium]|nr:SRPBCC family protein [Verrucomicrobiae bacterium]